MRESVLCVARAMARRGRVEVARLERAIAAAEAGEHGRPDPLWHLLGHAGATPELADRLAGALWAKWPSDAATALVFALESFSPEGDHDLVSLVEEGRFDEAISRVETL